MTMDEQTEQPQAPVEAPAPADSRDASINELLAQFDAETKQPEPDANNAVTNTELDALLNQLDGNALATANGRVSELEGQLGQRDGEISALRQAEFDRNEEKAFSTFADAIRQQIPDNGLPERWIEDKLISLAVKDKSILDAWTYRSVDRNAVDQQLRQVEEAVNHLQRTGGDPQKLAALQELGTRLGHAFNSAAILTRLERAVIKEAKAHKVYDEEMTQMRAEVSAAVRGASTPVPPERPPNLGAMSTQEYRAYLRTLGIHNF